MKKAYFWPAAMVVMGLVILADQVGLLPKDHLNLWPIILIIVGLGGLLIADRAEWLVKPETKRASKSTNKTKKTKKRS